MQTCRQFAVLVLLLLLNARANGQDWSTYQGNAAHTGYAGGTYDPNDFKLLWTRTYPQTNLKYATRIAAADGKVFLGFSVYSGTGIQELYGYDGSTGAELWSATRNGQVGSTSPAYAEGKVYWEVVGDSGNLYGLDATTGQELFHTVFSSQGVFYGVPTPYAGHLYGNSGYTGGMRGFDGTVGGIDWFRELPFQNGWSPAVDQNYAYVYMSGGSGSPGPSVSTFYALDRLTGAIAYTILNPQSNFPAGNYQNSNPLLGSQHNAFAIGQDPPETFGNPLVRFNLDSRTVSWSLPGLFQPGMALNDEILYVVNNGILEARDELSGGFLWSWASPNAGRIQSNIALTDSHAFVSDAVNTYAIDLASHQSTWSMKIVGSNLAIADQRLYIQGPAPRFPNTGHVAAISLVVPEPTSIVLGLSGGVALCVVARRARRQRERRSIHTNCR